MEHDWQKVHGDISQCAACGAVTLYDGSYEGPDCHARPGLDDAEVTTSRELDLAKLHALSKQNLRVEELKAEVAALREAMGLITTIKGSMPVNVHDPVGMAQETVEYVKALRDRNFLLENEVIQQHQGLQRWVETYSKQITAEKELRAEVESASAQRVVQAMQVQNLMQQRDVLEERLILSEQEVERLTAKLAKLETVVEAANRVSNITPRRPEGITFEKGWEIIDAVQDDLCAQVDALATLKEGK